MDGMSVRIQGVLVTSFRGVTKYLTKSHLKEQRFFLAHGLRDYSPSWRGALDCGLLHGRGVWCLQVTRTRVPIILVCNPQLVQLITPHVERFPRFPGQCHQLAEDVKTHEPLPFLFCCSHIPFFSCSI